MTTFEVIERQDPVTVRRVRVEETRGEAATVHSIIVTAYSVACVSHGMTCRVLDDYARTAEFIAEHSPVAR